MKIVKKLLDPSRPDAVRLRRNEKMSMLHFMYAVTILCDLVEEMKDRLAMVDGGNSRMEEIAKGADELLNELRVTIPEDQRVSLQNTAEDYVMRLMPSTTPSATNAIMTKDEFRELVDAARSKCRECILDDNECEQCKLYRLLTCVLPMNDYHCMNLCPYNLGEWKS